VILLLMEKADITSFYVVAWSARVGLIPRDRQILQIPFACLFPVLQGYNESINIFQYYRTI